MRPLRPATDHRLGEPLPHQLANQTRAPLQTPGLATPALISTCSKAGCYAVLASLSGRYPPLEGRSPTCYSPVCHSTHGLLHFRVRLACVRHAASVDSEPGSNSHVKFVALRLVRLRGLARGQLVNARPMLLALALFNPYWSRRHHQPPLPGLKTPVGRFRDATR